MMKKVVKIRQWRERGHRVVTLCIIKRARKMKTMNKVAALNNPNIH